VKSVVTGSHVHWCIVMLSGRKYYVVTSRCVPSKERGASPILSYTSDDGWQMRHDTRLWRENPTRPVVPPAAKSLSRFAKHTDINRNRPLTVFHIYHQYTTY